MDNESDDHANFSCGESEVTLQQYTADQEMYAISKNKKKNNNNNEKANNYFKHLSPSARKFAISCGILARFPFSHYFQYFSPKTSDDGVSIVFIS